MNATIRNHLTNYLQEKKTFVDKFLENHDVDDSTFGVKIWEEVGRRNYLTRTQRECFKRQDLSWENGSKIAQSCKYILKREKILKTNWKRRQRFYSEFQLKGDINNSKFLSIKWFAGNDEFVFRFKKTIELAETLEITKRNILRDDFGRWFRDPDLLLRSETGCKTYETAMKLSVVEEDLMESQAKIQKYSLKKVMTLKLGP